LALFAGKRAPKLALAPAQFSALMPLICIGVLWFSVQ